METEEQQIEALKKWWGENGRTVVAGLVLGLGGVVGWNYWQHYEETEAEQASRLYTAVVEAASSEEHDQVLERTQALLEAHPDSGYAALANLIAARSAAASGDAGRALSYLGWVAENAAAEPWKDLARVRLARLQASTGKVDEALGTLGGIASSGFETVVLEVRGDALVAANRSDEARTAYETALADEDLSALASARIRTKLDDLGQLAVE